MCFAPPLPRARPPAPCALPHPHPPRPWMPSIGAHVGTDSAITGHACPPQLNTADAPSALATHPLTSVPSFPLSSPTLHHTSLNSFLDHVDVGDCVVTGELEAYSCECGGRGVVAFVSPSLFLSTRQNRAPSLSLNLTLSPPHSLRQARRLGQEAVPLPGRGGRAGLVPAGAVHVARRAAGGAVEV